MVKGYATAASAMKQGRNDDARIVGFEDEAREEVTRPSWPTYPVFGLSMPKPYPRDELNILHVFSGRSVQPARAQHPKTCRLFGSSWHKCSHTWTGEELGPTAAEVTPERRYCPYAP